MRAVTHSDDPGRAAVYWSASMIRTRAAAVTPSAQQVELESAINFISETLADLDQLVNHANPETLNRARLNLAIDDYQDALVRGLQTASKLQRLIFEVPR